jgi:hypothetical protein
MPKKKKEAAAPKAPVVTRSPKITLPPKREREQANVGVTAVRRTRVAGGPGKRKMGAMEAATMADAFKKGGEAFVQWLRKEHPEVNPRDRRTQADWEPLVQEFAARPIHGHRRGKQGGNHRRSRR